MSARFCGLVFLVMGLMIPSSASSRDPEEPVHPTTYRSGSGKFAWRIDPSDLYGNGPADYAVFKDGEEVWRGRKDYTVYDAVVSDDGKVIGYAYTRGLDPGFRDLGDFKIVMIGLDGREIVNQTIKRQGSRFLHDVANPMALGIELNEREDRFAIRIRDEDLNKRQEELWSYRISTGAQLARKERAAQRYARSRQEEKLFASFNVEDLPNRELKEVGRLRLKTAPSAPSPVRNVLEMRIDGEQRIGFLRRDSESAYSFVLVSSSGQLVFETSLKIPHKFVYDFLPRVAWVQGKRWIVVASEGGEGGKARAWWIDVDLRKVAEVRGFDCPPVEQVTGDRVGGFVVLAQMWRRYSSEDELSRFDSNGRLMWRKRQGGYSGKNDDLLSPEDLIVTRNGEIAVLDNIRHTVQYFALDGKMSRLLDLKAERGKEPNYPTEIRADFAGGVLIRDFHGKPEIVRMDAAGKVRAQFDPRYADGRKYDVARGIDVSPDGRVWASDGESIVRLTDDGMVDRVIGSSVSADALTEVAAMHVSDKGEIFAADRRTASVHVFDASGSRARVCKAAMDDFGEKLVSAEIAVTANSEVFLSDRFVRKEFVHFDANGSRVGLRSFGIDSIHEVLYPREDGSFLMLGYHDAFLLRNEGSVSRKISRRADGNWLVYARAGSVAKDGSFVVASGPGFYSRQAWPVTIYAADGEARKTIILPAECRDLAWTGKLVLTRTDAELVAIEAEGKGSWMTPLGKEWKNSGIFAPYGGREVWIADANGKMVLRLELSGN